MTLLSGQTAEQDTTAEASAFKHAEARDDRSRTALALTVTFPVSRY